MRKVLSGIRSTYNYLPERIRLTLRRFYKKIERRGYLWLVLLIGRELFADRLWSWANHEIDKGGKFIVIALAYLVAWLSESPLGLFGSMVSVLLIAALIHSYFFPEKSETQTPKASEDETTIILKYPDIDYWVLFKKDTRYVKMLANLRATELKVLHKLWRHRQVGKIKIKQRFSGEDQIQLDDPAISSLGMIAFAIGKPEAEIEQIAERLVSQGLCFYCTSALNREIKTICLSHEADQFIAACRESRETNDLLPLDHKYDYWCSDEEL